MQADMDTPYPQTKAGNMTSAWTRFDADKQPTNGTDGRLGINRRREGKI